MHIFAIVVILAGMGEAGENLLVNPGFDDLDLSGNPTRWDVFVMPMDGALGKVDSTSSNGSYAVMLYNPEPYRDEPSNNWSQPIIADLSGKTLHISGSIKTEDATKAALWLQCFRKNPARVLAAATTITDSPVYGTSDWTRVEATIDVPPGTDFLVMRCVLEGRGRAWFDDIEVKYLNADETDPATASNEKSGGIELGRQDVRTSQALLRSSEAMWEAIESLRETNDRLLLQIRSLQDDIATLRPAAQTITDLEIDAPEPSPFEPLFNGHPLVPHTREQRGAP